MDGVESLKGAARHVPAFGISCPGVIPLCGPIDRVKMLGLSVLISDSAASTLLDGAMMDL